MLQHMTLSKKYHVVYLSHIGELRAHFERECCCCHVCIGTKTRGRIWDIVMKMLSTEALFKLDLI